jgi:hypothetical protein
MQVRCNGNVYKVQDNVWASSKQYTK